MLSAQMTNSTSYQGILIAVQQWFGIAVDGLLTSLTRVYGSIC